MKKIIFLFYNHYNSGSGKPSAYPSALWAVLTLGMVNAFSLMLYLNFALLKKYSYLNSRSWEQNLLVVVITYFILGYHVLWMLYKKEDIEVLQYPADVVKRGNRTLISYTIGSLCILALMVAKYYIL